MLIWSYSLLLFMFPGPFTIFYGYFSKTAISFYTISLHEEIELSTTQKKA